MTVCRRHYQFQNTEKTLDPGLRRDDGSKVSSTSISTVIPAQAGTQRLSSINKFSAA